MQAVIRIIEGGNVKDKEIIDNFYDVRFLCNECDRRFKSPEGVWNHKRDKHGYDDRSFAERALDAELAIACGEPTDDAWLLP